MRGEEGLGVSWLSVMQKGAVNHFPVAPVPEWRVEFAELVNECQDGERMRFGFGQTLLQRFPHLSLLTRLQFRPLAALNRLLHYRCPFAHHLSPRRCEFCNALTPASLREQIG